MQNCVFSRERHMSATSGYRLYYAPDNASLIVRIALEEIGAAYAAVLVDRGGSALRSDAFLRLNPQGLLPVLVDGETAIFETAAILLHLIDKHAGLGPRPGDSARPDLYRWLFYLSNTLHADLRTCFHPERQVADPDTVQSLLVGSQTRALQHCRLLENHLASHGGPFFLASGFSVCDIYIAVCCRWLQIYPRHEPLGSVRLAALPSLWRLLGMLEARPAVHRSCAAEWIDAPFFRRPTSPNPPAR